MCWIFLPIPHSRAFLEGRCHLEPCNPCDYEATISSVFKAAVVGNSHKAAALLSSQFLLLGRETVGSCWVCVKSSVSSARESGSHSVPVDCSYTRVTAQYGCTLWFSRRKQISGILYDFSFLSSLKHCGLNNVCWPVGPREDLTITYDKSWNRRNLRNLWEPGVGVGINPASVGNGSVFPVKMNWTESWMMVNGA